MDFGTVDRNTIGGDNNSSRDLFGNLRESQHDPLNTSTRQHGQTIVEKDDETAYVKSSMYIGRQASGKAKKDADNKHSTMSLNKDEKTSLKDAHNLVYH